MQPLHSNLLTAPAPGRDCLPARSQPLLLALMDPLHPGRARAEAFVQLIFRQAYGAQLQSFYPLLMSILFPDGDYAAVAGVRPAGSETVFSEHYLDKPVERILGVTRQQIVEIGNLAPASAGQARWLICTLTAFLGGAGFTHVVFTAIPKLKNAFGRMGLPLTKLADASAEQLPPGQDRIWGSYYECGPAVYSGDIRIGVQAFRKAIGVDQALREIWTQARDLGRAFAKSGDQRCL